VNLAPQVIAGCLARNWTLVTAESCTGGLLAAALTDVPGASAVFDRGFVTYSNAAKTQMLGVPAQSIAAHGAVSRDVAISMARHALTASGTDLAVAVTGIAGPAGGSREKPVGLVHFAWATRAGKFHHQEMQFGDLGRNAIRQAAVKFALQLLLDALA
jgi:nicotinamide-nucleotide amidase